MTPARSQKPAQIRSKRANAARSLGVADERRAPAHLAQATRVWWERLGGEWSLEPHHLALLTAAGETWDRLQAARETIAAEGSYYRDRFGQPRPHPALAVERDCRIAFARLVRELGLDDVTDPDAARPPRRGR